MSKKVENIMIKKIVLGGGCFWCIEAVYTRTKGIISAISAYTGGDTLNPTYNDICTGTTNHAEVVIVSYNDEIISLETILEIFWVIHDPTSLNQQGGDRGTQYRSVIYYDNEEEKNKINTSIEEIQEHFSAKIVTEVSALTTIYEAESYHQNYLSNNPSQGYCQAVVAPKVQKFKMNFKEMIKL